MVHIHFTESKWTIRAILGFGVNYDLESSLYLERIIPTHTNIPPECGVEGLSNVPAC